MTTEAKLREEKNCDDYKFLHKIADASISLMNGLL